MKICKLDALASATRSRHTEGISGQLIDLFEGCDRAEKTERTLRVIAIAECVSIGKESVSSLGACQNVMQWSDHLTQLLGWPITFDMDYCFRSFSTASVSALFVAAGKRFPGSSPPV
jgi:hypothetical protein